MSKTETGGREGTACHRAPPKGVTHRDALGRPHRAGGPAIISRMGRFWYFCGRLHREDGPAVEGAFGTRMYYWHGIMVPGHLIENRHELTIDRAMAEQNTELQRIMIEIVGWEELVRHPRCKEIDNVPDLRATLFNFAMPAHNEEWRNLVGSSSTNPDQVRTHEDIRLVKVADATELDAGRRREYIIRVPPTIETARAAVAWTFSLAENDYYPSEEA